MLNQCDFEFTGSRKKEYAGAGGDRLALLDRVVDVKVYVDKLGWIILRNVLVLRQESKVQKTLLVGRFDLQRLKVSMDFSKGVVSLSDPSGGRKTLKMARKSSSAVARVKKATKLSEELQAGPMSSLLPPAGESVRDSWHEDPSYDNNNSAMAAAIQRQFAALDDVDEDPVGMISVEDPEKVQQEHTVVSDKWSTKANLGDPCHFYDPCCTGCDECIDTKIADWLKKNGPAPCLDDMKSDDEIVHSLRSYIERERQRARSSYTHKQCTIDPGFRAKHPETTVKLETLLEKYKQVFAGDIGKVPDMYNVKVKMVGELSPQRPGHQKFQGTTLIAILKQFMKQIAHGILVDIFEEGCPEEDRIVPKSYLNTLPIKKKDDDGKVLEATSALRVVVDSTPVNAHTQFRAGQSDNMNDALNFAAATSVKGFNFKADVGDAYYTIGMDRSMWAYFCVVVPFLGTFAYTRLVQGWAPSANYCMEILARIYFELHPVL